MRRVGVREFRDHATQYLAGDEVLTIERHGQPIGFYIPAGPDRPRRANKKSAAQALQRLEHTVQEVLAQTGLTEEELSELFDLSKPLPETTPIGDADGIADEHAARR
jgi:antitoxin (DNA-binding transcriptional repressor) of toxin-antitoxin stability system